MKSKIVNIFVCMLLFATVLSVAVTMNVSSIGTMEDDWWSMFRHDPNYTGHSTSAAPNSPYILWTFDTGSSYDLDSSPAIVNDRVYIGSDNDKIYCLDVKTREEIWNYPINGGFRSSPAIANGSICIGAANGKVYCFGLNEAPNQPSTPSGPTEGVVEEEYTFSTSATDPEGHNVSYGWDWDGDDEVDEWTEFYNSGITVETIHSWAEAGTYDIKVKAKDEYEAEGDWSPIHTIHIGVPELTIGEIKGGILQVSAEIKNTGDADLTNVEWHITVKGGIFGLINITGEGIIAMLAQNGTEIGIASPIFGLGSVDITVTASAADLDPVIKEATAFVLGPFVLNVEEI